MIKAVNEKKQIVQCPECLEIFPNDTYIVEWIADFWRDRAHTIHDSYSKYVCTVCGTAQDDISDYYKEV